MEDFNIYKYFREKLFEQEDIMSPEDNDTESAFTKGEKEEEDQEEISNPDYEEDLADVRKEVANIIVSGNSKVGSILPLKPLLSIIEDQFDNPKSDLQKTLKEEIFDEEIETVVESALSLLPIVATKILFFEYILPDKPDDKLIEPILGELATYFGVDINKLVAPNIGDSVKYFKYQNNKIKSGDYDKIKFVRHVGFVRK